MDYYFFSPHKISYRIPSATVSTMASGQCTCQWVVTVLPSCLHSLTWEVTQSQEFHPQRNSKLQIVV